MLLSAFSSFVLLLCAASVSSSPSSLWLQYPHQSPPPSVFELVGFISLLLRGDNPKLSESKLKRWPDLIPLTFVLPVNKRKANILSNFIYLSFLNELQTDPHSCLPLRLSGPLPGRCGLGSHVCRVWPQCAAPLAEPRGHQGRPACPSHWLRNPPAPGQVYTVTSSYQSEESVMLIQCKVSKKADGLITKCWTSPLLQVVVDKLYFLCQCGVLVKLLHRHLWSGIKCVRHWLQGEKRIKRVGFSFVGLFVERILKHLYSICHMT